MAVYYKFKSARDFDSISMDGPFISVGTLKEKIFESKHLGKGTDFDLVVTNAQTNEEYPDEAMLIPKNTSVLIRRVPGRPRMPIVAAPEPNVANQIENAQPEKSSFLDADSSVPKYPEDSEWDEFGNDLYSIPETLPVQSSNPLPDVPPSNIDDEESKIKALIDTPALDWLRQGADGFGPGRGFGRGMGGRMGGHGFGLERKTPPLGYVCHRCKVPGHFIQHCPTNGDPNYDIKRVKPPTGIPKSMLMATPDGSYALPSGAVAVLKPNEDAFEKEIEGLPSTRSVADLPPELHCPVCKEVMKDAVLTSKCCFTSFCDKCIRDHIISKSMCVCGATNILADDLLPNKTLRDTINRILESGNSSADNAGSTFQVQDMESSRGPQPKIPSPTASAASKGEQKPVFAKEESPDVKDKANQMKEAIPPQQVFEKVKTTKLADASEATLESMSVKEPASQGSAPLLEEEVQQKVASGEAGKKKKKKKVHLPANDLQWKTPQDLAAENYMMSMGPSAYNPYWTGMQPGMDGFMGPYTGVMPYMGGYGLGPMNMPFGGVMPPDPFGAQNYMFPPVPPRRDLAEFGMGMNVAPPIMSREEFEARQATLRRKRENERRGERDLSRDREFVREVSSSADASSWKSKSKPIPQMSGGDHRHEHHRHRSERTSPERSLRDYEAPPPRPSKRKADQHHDLERDYDRNYDDGDHGRDRHHHHHHHHRSESTKLAPEPAPKLTSTTTTSEMDNKSKPNVFSRISFPEEEISMKKRKISSDAPASSGHRKPSSNGYDYKTSSVSAKSVSTTSGGGRKSSSSNAVDYESSDDRHYYESSDDDRHFKRKPSRYESSPPPSADREEEPRHSRGSRERERERERGSYSKHRM
ncbi:E3 ubiquitin ligase PARAQUAT TOLERANCE 3-like isoform X1 [Hibiscus syriacus]|uniref:E3 ubiquitin ligase PARAQUAT TOLERANCE 3-like isoform X1 n=1 Tax=Hibiscus syriacus TaxID=106335 RepID=UPI001920F908|nr:E3 ubiquitin ligase PARAQUAT TOLERANCE 3-like isoform X1 [Hibiscus syriacus]